MSTPTYTTTPRAVNWLAALVLLPSVVACWPAAGAPAARHRARATAAVTGDSPGVRTPQVFASAYRPPQRRGPSVEHSPAVHQPIALPGHHAASAPRADFSSAPAVHEAEDGFNITGRDFSLHVDRSGALTDIARHGQMVFTRAALEVRGKTWHTKLAPTPDQVQASAPRADDEGAHFHYAVRMDDAASGIKLDFQEALTVRAAGILDLTLNMTPRAPFDSQRIAWTLQFPADRFVGKRYDLVSADGEHTSASFPQDRAPDPHMARNFSTLRLDDGLGPIDLKFSTSGRHSQPLPDENMLEDLRWWNADRFWVETAAPYGPADRPVETPLGIQPDDSRTLRISIDLHAAAAR